MKIINITKYLRFIDKEVKKKTKIVGVVNIHHDEEIGEIKWFSRWRQYTFYPSDGTVWNKDCLNDINSVINKLMEERKNAKV